MKKTSKSFYIFMVVVLSVLLSLGATATAASHPFKDVMARYDESVSYFYNEGIIKGKSNTEFGTYDSLKRGDAAVILSGALGLDTKNAPDAGFKDVNNRIKAHVNALVKKGVIKGFNDTEFSPDTHLTRGQMAAILVRAFDLGKYAKETPFTDLSPTFKGDIEALYGANITGGITATKYGTNELIKRGDFTVLLYKTMNLEKDEVEVKSIKELNPIHAPMGATLAEVDLPQEVEVVYDDNTTGKKKVQWATTEFDTNIEKEYVLQGTVEGTTLKASVKVVVHNPAVQQPNDIVVLKGTSLTNANLPKQVKLSYYGTSVNRNVTWDTANLDLNEVGTYVLDGDIERLSRNTTIKVIVSGIDVEKLQDIYVVKGTDIDDVELPGTVKLNYPDRSHEYKNITWNASGLDLNKVGEYTLTGAIDDTSWTTTVKVIVTEGEYPDKVELDKTSVTLLRGTSVQLTATLNPSAVTNKNVKWTSDNKSVATVDQNGKVTALAKGTAVITVTTANEKTAKATITVVEDTIPYLEVNAEASTIRGNIREIQLSMQNDSPNSLILEKIEVYENNELKKTFTKSDFQTEGYSTVIAPNSIKSVNLELRPRIGTNNSFVKIYISLNGETFIYTRSL